MKLYIKCITFEITRKCNMRCSHCLRGPAENVEMDHEIINLVTRQVDSATSITFSGGEPSLNGKAINHFRWASYFYDFDFLYFWVTTNARYFKKEFYDALRELYCVCGKSDMCTLTISKDQYHGIMSNKAYDKYSVLPFFSDERMRDINPELVLDEGMAHENYLGGQPVQLRSGIESYNIGRDELEIDDFIYINALGNVLLDCDLSYARQKEYSIGNVLQEPLAEILMRQLVPLNRKAG